MYLLKRTLRIKKENKNQDINALKLFDNNGYITTNY